MSALTRAALQPLILIGRFLINLRKLSAEEHEQPAGPSESPTLQFGQASRIGDISHDLGFNRRSREEERDEESTAWGSSSRCEHLSPTEETMSP